MLWLRSALFVVLLALVTAFYAVVVFCLVWLPFDKLYGVPKAWAHTLLWLLKVVCGLDYRIEGQENLPERPFISMWKHSSTWETMAQMIVVPPASWILKREVLWIPLVGWAVMRFRPIAINRGAGARAVNQVVRQGRERLADGLGVIIYPEGTRAAPGQTRKYGISGALLATETGAPVVPIAHNSGYFWRRRGLIKHPGTVRVVIGPPIDPAGLTPREVNTRVQAWIESTVAQIVAQPGGKPG
jgi:1-acyl-sn-glycerol-3-phosphate acyltransferase